MRELSCAKPAMNRENGREKVEKLSSFRPFIAHAGDLLDLSDAQKGQRAKFPVNFSQETTKQPMSVRFARKIIGKSTWH